MTTALAVACILGQNVAEQSQALKIAQENFDTVKLFGIETKVGTGNEKDSTSAKFAFDLNYPKVLIGEKTQAGWGIPCIKAEDNSCQVIDPSQVAVEEIYAGYKFQVKDASLHLRVDVNHKLNTTNTDKTELAKLPIRLVTGGDKTPFKDWGSIGLSPNSAFGTYLSKVYHDSAKLVLLYKTQTYEEEDTKLAYGVYLNPKIVTTDVVRTYNLTSNSDSWSFPVDHVSPVGQFSLKGEKACINSVARTLIMVENPIALCDDYRRFLCQGKPNTNGTDCKKADVKLDTLKNLVFTEKDFTYEFTPAAYIYFDKSNFIQCRFGDIKKSTLCPAGSKIGFGQLFLAKYIPLLEFNEQGKRSLTFLKDFKPPVDPINPDTKSNMKWIIIAAVAAAIALIVLVAVIMRKKKTSDADYYRDFDATAQH